MLSLLTCSVSRLDELDPYAVSPAPLQSRRVSKGFGFIKTTPPLNNSKRRRLRKMTIGMPTDFRHEHHLGNNMVSCIAAFHRSTLTTCMKDSGKHGFSVGCCTMAAGAREGTVVSILPVPPIDIVPSSRGYHPHPPLHPLMYPRHFQNPTPLNETVLRHRNESPFRHSFLTCRPSGHLLRLHHKISRYHLHPPRRPHQNWGRK